MKPQQIQSLTITEQNTCSGIWSFYPEIVMDLKKKKCCKSYKKDKRCKKCPMNS